MFFHSYSAYKFFKSIPEVSFIGGDISVTVDGKRSNKGIGLEIPATYEFKHKKPSKINKLKELIKDKEVKEVKDD